MARATNEPAEQSRSPVGGLLGASMEVERDHGDHFFLMSIGEGRGGRNDIMRSDDMRRNYYFHNNNTLNPNA